MLANAEREHACGVVRVSDQQTSHSDALSCGTHDCGVQLLGKRYAIHQVNRDWYDFITCLLTVSRFSTLQRYAMLRLVVLI